MDTTLPQYRHDESVAAKLGQNDRFSKMYFFYGTLANPDVLAQQLNLPSPPRLDIELGPAYIQGGRLRCWGGMYRALVDDFDNGEESWVGGYGFVVNCKEQEDALRAYVTDKYVVVRCKLFTETGKIWGLTFRYCGPADQLGLGGGGGVEQEGEWKRGIDEA